jgi:hypothetical protein
MKGHEKKKLRGRGVGIILLKDPIFIIPIAKGMGHMKRITTYIHGRRLETQRIKKKT